MNPTNAKGFHQSPMLSVILVLGSAAACSEARPFVDEPQVVRDSAGIGIIESALPTEEWTVGRNPELRLGVVSGDPALQFSGVSFAARLGDGRVVVLDRGSLEIRYFSREGAPIVALGGEGGGPEEFRSFRGAWLASDETLRIYDGESGRVVAVGPEPHIVGYQSATGVPVPPTRTNVLGLLQDGRLAVMLRPPVRPANATAGTSYVRDTATVVAFTLDTGDPPDTIIRLPAMDGLRTIETTLSPRGTETVGRVSLQPLPLSYDAYGALLGGELVVATSDRPELRVIAADGRALRILRQLGRKEIPVAEFRGRYMQFVAESSAARVVPGAASSGATDEGLWAALDETRLVPFFDRVIVDAEQQIWTREHMLPWSTEEPQMWTVHGENGHVVARAVTPPGLNVTHIGSEHITGIMRDELGVEHVLVYRLEGRPSR